MPVYMALMEMNLRLINLAGHKATVDLLNNLHTF